MDKNFNTKKKYITWGIALFASLLLAVIAASLYGDNVRQSVKNWFNSGSSAIVEKSYASADIQRVNYEGYGNYFVSVNNDPQLILSGINDYVENVTVHFSEPVKSSISSEIFYSTNQTEFVPEQMLRVQVNEGEKKVTITISRQVSSLRLDLGSASGIEFQLDKVVLNENVQRTTFSRIAQCMRENAFRSIWYDRVELFFLLFFFISLHFLVGIKKLYATLFERRWIVAAILLLFLVVNRYNGDSPEIYDGYVQTGEGNDYISTILGEPRGVRSDEWMVASPIALSRQYLEHPYSGYNEILRGTKTVRGTNAFITCITKPWYVIEIVLNETAGYDYGFSFSWYFGQLLGFLCTIELFMILSGKKRLLSFCGTCMIFFSSYYLWWAFPVYFCWGNASLVCVYYFLQQTEWRKKIAFAIGVCYSVANFVLILYPAWQVPMAYIALAVLVWILHDNWDRIRSLTKMEWLTIGIAFVACVGMIGANLIAQREYVAVITATEYPGSRVEYGGFSINKLFNYIGAVLFAYKDIGNASEAGVCINFFPIPMLMGIYLWIRQKKKDWLLAGLLLVSVFITVYTTCGLPPVIAKVTLMTYTTAARGVDLLAYLQVLLFVRVLATYELQLQLDKRIGSILALVSAVILVYFGDHYLPDYMSRGYLVLSVCVLSFVFAVIVSRVPERWKNAGLLAIIFISLITGVYVRPITKGSDAITSKPLAKEITKITEQQLDTKWLAVGGSVVLPSFAIACGAPTINSVNTYPNMELWRALDPEGQYNVVYNRYAHVALNIVEEDTSFELIQEDSMYLNLSYKDIPLTGATHIVSLQKLEVDNEYVAFQEIYNEGGSYIYEISYK